MMDFKLMNIQTAKLVKNPVQR